MSHSHGPHERPRLGRSTGHRHEHGHQHHRGLWSRIGHTLGAHHHAPTDRVDDALRTSSLGLRTVSWSFAVLAVTAVAQLTVVALTGSIALLGDTIHNAADALTAVPLAAAFLLGRRPASHRYTYGLGRAEDLAGVVVVLVVATSAALAGYQAVWHILHPQPITHLWAVALAAVIGFAGNEVVARLRIRVGQRIGSAALVADGMHARTDGFTSLAVLLGAAGVALGFGLADPVIGLGIAGMILFVARDAAKDVLHRLMDAVDPTAVARARQAAGEVADVRGVGRARMRWIGHELHAELTVSVDPELTVEQAHRIAHDVEHALVHAVARLTSVQVHVEPSVRAEDAHSVLGHHGPR
jgi:cation diffusion facilitator family transporter